MRRAPEQASRTILDHRTSVVDRPWDGRELTRTERREWFANGRRNAGFFSAKNAELSARYNLTEERPFSRRLLRRIQLGLREEGEEE